MNDNNIFSELYNKLLGFFRQAEEEENTKDVARNRLRVVLMQDRTNLTPQLLERMRGELVELLSKYLEMDKDALELNLDHDGEQMALALSIPVIRAKDEEEIEQAIAEANEKKETENSETEETDEDEKDVSEEETDEKEIDTDKEDADTDVDSVEDISNTKTKSTKTSSKKSDDKEICSECKECKSSDDVECEKKNKK